MSNHTLHTEKTGRRRRIVVAGVSIPVIPAVALLATAGVALAAVLLITNISGKATIERVAGTANGITLVGQPSDNGTALSCTVDVGPDAKTLKLDTHLKITENGSNADSQPVPGGVCTINLAVENKGTKPIKVDGSQTALQAPTGYTVTRFEGPAVSGAIQPGETKTLSADITALNNATEGDFGGKLVYTDAA